MIVGELQGWEFWLLFSDLVNSGVLVLPLPEEARIINCAVD